jgi:hypothetical protein
MPMIAAATGRAVRANAADTTLSGALRDLYRAEPIFTIAGLVLLALMVPTGMAAVVDDRLFHGIDIWEKPLKFDFALAFYLLTLAFFARWLPAGMTARTGYRLYAGVVVAAIAAETVWISGAATYGTASHFNESTPFHAVLYAVMGGLAAVLTSATAVYAVAIARNPAPLAPAGRAALVLGLTAFTLAQNGGHWVGGTPDDSMGVPIFGWSRDGGDLRVPHFFSTHAMHFVPAFGLVSILLFGRERRWPVVAFAALYTAFVALVFVQALAGRPFPF